MEQHLHKLSGAFFYFFGVSFFVAYILFYNTLGGLWPRWWMEVFDLPLALVAILYGGTSLHLSIRRPESKGVVSAIVIGIPLLTFFALLFLLNFWEVLTLPGAGV